MDSGDVDLKLGKELQFNATKNPSPARTAVIAASKFFLKISPLFILPIGVLVAISYWQGWWWAFGLNESLLRQDLLNLHLMSFNLVLFGIASVALWTATGVAVVALAGYFVFYLIEIVSRQLKRVAHRVRPPRKLNAPKKARWWLKSGELVHQISAFFLLALLLTLLILTYPAKLAHDLGEKDGMLFIQRGYAGVPGKDGQVYVGCVQTKADAGKQIQGLFLACGDKFCGIVTGDGNPDVIPLASLAQMKVYKKPAAQFLKSPAFAFCGGQQM